MIKESRYHLIFGYGSEIRPHRDRDHQELTWKKKKPELFKKTKEDTVLDFRFGGGEPKSMRGNHPIN